MLREGHIRIARHNPLPQTEIAKKGKVLIPSPSSVAENQNRQTAVTWFFLPLSSPLAHPHLEHPEHRLSPLALMPLVVPLALLALVLLEPAAEAEESLLSPPSCNLPKSE
jgi:hypothetical protein